jgi:hypothetical protein
MEVPEECQEIHEDFIKIFTLVSVEQLNNKVDEIVKDEEISYFGESLGEIMKMLKPSKEALPAPIQLEVPRIMPAPVLSQKLIPFEVDFGQYKAFEMAKEVLIKNDILSSSQFIRTLMD